MILGRLKTVWFKVRLRFDKWIDIKCCGTMGMVVLKVPSEDFDQRNNNAQNVYVQMRHGGLVVGSIILELLPEFLHLEDQRFSYIVHRIR